MQHRGDSLAGYGYAIGAYLLWGFLPFYMKAVSHMPPVEILAHRILWAVPVAGLVLILRRRMGDVLVALRSPRTLAMGVVTAALISVNWLIYIWSIVHGQAVEAALGYYINPLFSVFLARVLLGEKLSPLKWLAIGLAAAAVAVLTLKAGRLPLVALGLTVSWGTYAYFKKSLPIGPNQGFLLEVLILLPFAAGYTIWLATTGRAHFMAGVASDTWLLLAAGLVTAVPLMLYANGAKLLRLSTIGMLQYIAPTLIFLVAVFAFGEPFGSARAIAFPMIWAALVFFSVALMREARR